MVEQVKKLTKHGAGGGIDAVGGKTGAAVLKCLKNSEKLIIYGLLSRNNITPIDMSEMIFKETIIKGFWLIHWYQNTSSER